MLIGEVPGDQQDRQGKPFVGPAGTLLRMLLNEAGIDLKHAAESSGFRAKIACTGGGSAMVLLEKPAVVQQPGEVPHDELTRLFCHSRNTIAGLINQARSLCPKFPKDRDARFLLAEALRGAGMDDLAAVEYQLLLQDCSPNERQRAAQGLAQCQADRGYFPDFLAAHLSSAIYVSGHNAEVWGDYFWREIRRGRKIVRLVRHVTTLRGKRVLDVGSGYRGMLISMAEQGANVTGIEIDPEHARMGQLRLKKLQLDVPHIEGDICFISLRRKFPGEYGFTLKIIGSGLCLPWAKKYL
jgi:hypothetical protein